MRRLTLLTLFFCSVMLNSWGQDFHKMTTYLSDLVHQHRRMSSSSVSGDAKILVLTTFTHPERAQEVLSSVGASLESRIGRIYIIKIAVRQLSALSMSDAVERIEASRMPRPKMNVTPRWVNAYDAFDGTGLPQAFNGSGVVTGSVDSGHDFTHPAFYDSSDRLRVGYFYDCISEQEYTTPEAIAVVQHSVNALHETHGTHVMGIMSGSQVGPYRGMASEADIAICDFNSDREDFESPDGGITSALCILCFKKIFDWADSQGKPCVINFSNGESAMFSVPRTLEREAIESMLGPGHIIVSAAGNEGDQGCYWVKPERLLRAETPPFRSGVLSSNILSVDLRAKEAMNITFKTEDGERVSFSTSDILSAEGDYIEKTVSINGTSVVFSARHVACEADSIGDVYHFYADLKSLWYLDYHDINMEVTGEGQAEVVADILISCFSSQQNQRYMKSGFTLNWPADIEDVIAVGATNFTGVSPSSFSPSVSNAPLAYFSSVGPALSGLVKPDVVAPGYEVVSALNSFASGGSYPDYQVTFHDQRYGYFSASGTSMAAPVVTGSIALWLQADPTLTPSDVKAILSATSMQNDCASYPNSQYGYGQIDVYKGLLYILSQSDGISTISSHQPQDARFSLRGSTLYITFQEEPSLPFSVCVYTTEGKKVVESRNQRSIDLSGLSDDVYAVQLNTGRTISSGSTLIRLSR